MKTLFVLIGAVILAFHVKAQENLFVEIHVRVHHQNKLLVLEDSLYTSSEGIPFKLETCRFYLSAICLYQDQQRVYAETNSYHLIDVADPSSLTIRLQIPKSLTFNTLSVLLGVDSLTNVSGARGGDLDPTKGMYWAWQSGYVNAKIEGRTYAPGKKFEWHLGGYQFPYATAQPLTLSAPQGSSMQLTLDFSKFLSSLHLSSQSSVMSPGTEAQRLSKLLATCFELQ